MNSLQIALLPDWKRTSYWVEIILIAAFTALLSAASVLSDLEFKGLTIVWWPAAIPIVTYWSRGVNRWPAILFGYLIHYYFFYPAGEFFLIDYAWLLATVNTIEAIPLVMLLKRLKVTSPFFQWRDSMLFLAIGVFPVGLLSSFVAISLFASRNFETDLIELYWWYAGNLLAVLLVVPFFISFQNREVEQKVPRRILYWAVLSVVSMLFGFLSLFPVFQIDSLQLPYSLVFIPIYLIACLTLGIKGVATVNFIGGVIAVLAYSLNESPWPSSANLSYLYIFWAVMIVVPTVFLILGAYVDKRRAE